MYSRRRNQNRLSDKMGNSHTGGMMSRSASKRYGFINPCVMLPEAHDQWGTPEGAEVATG
jgi:hypothetical protein